MKLILTQEVNGLGEPGDVVEVKDGYGRNYLVPRKLATLWTKGGESQVSAIRTARSAREMATLEDAQAARSRLQAKTVMLAVRSGASGRLFGSVTPGDIVDAIVAAGGPAVDRRKVIIERPIKTLGSHIVTVRLHADVAATVDVEVVGAAAH